MAFFDRSKIFPPVNNGIKLQEFDNNNQYSNEHGLDGSGDYAVNKAAVLNFLCDYHIDSLTFGDDSSTAKSNRLVSFKGFIEDLQFKSNIEYEDGGSNFSPITDKYLKGYKLGYNLSFNVVAHSVNDAISNMARYSELERILIYPFQGTQNIGGSDPDVRIPSAYVFMSNLINNGVLAYKDKYEKIRISNEFVRKHGLRIAVQSIKLDPDLDMGFFHYNDKTYFKSFKITLEIPITNDLFHYDHLTEKKQLLYFKTLFPYIRRKDDNGKVYYGHKKNNSYADNALPRGQFDSKGFPFCIPFSSSKILKSYAKGVQAYGANKREKIGICINSSKITQRDNPNITRNYCVFDAFVESFSYERTQKSQDQSGFDDPSSNRPSFAGKGVTTFNFAINVPSYSVVDAEANCMKINSLFRMINLQKTEKLPGGPVRVLFNNIIKDVRRTQSLGKYDFIDIYNNGLPCFVTSLNVTIDAEAGFFEYNQYFLPKAMKLDFQIVYNKNFQGNIFITDSENKNETTYYDKDNVRWPFGIVYNDT